MDHISASFYQNRFKIAFLEKKGTEFQNLFANLAGHALGSDFEAIRSHGSQGDWKSDGRQLSTGTIFQCYAPETLTDKKTINKINEDFAGALSHWGEKMKVWVFVHNRKGGVSPSVSNCLDSLREQHPGLTIEIWQEARLFELFNLLTDDAKQLLFGSVPNQRSMDHLRLSDLEPVIDALEQQELDPGDEILSPPSLGKLEKNNLSDDSAELLRFGRRKVKLVEQYFRKSSRVELGERIAEAFRKQYSYLKSLDLPPELIFMHLQTYAGMSGEPKEPKRQAASMAVLAYYFDMCDIFEDPDFKVDH